MNNNILVFSMRRAGHHFIMELIKENLPKNYIFINDINNGTNFFRSYDKFASDYPKIINLEFHIDRHSDIFYDINFINSTILNKKIIFVERKLENNLSSYLKAKKIQANDVSEITKKISNSFLCNVRKFNFIKNNFVSCNVINYDRILLDNSHRISTITDICQIPQIEYKDQSIKKIASQGSSFGEKNKPGNNFIEDNKIELLNRGDYYKDNKVFLNSICKYNNTIKEIDFFLIFFGEPWGLHRLSLESWNNSGYTYHLFVDKKESWEVMCKDYNNIKVYYYDKKMLENDLKKIVNLSTEDVNYLFNRGDFICSLKPLLCSLKPLLLSLFEKYVSKSIGYYWGWVDHDTLISKLNLFELDDDECYLFKAPFFVTTYKNKDLWKNKNEDYNFIYRVRKKELGCYDESIYLQKIWNDPNKKYSMVSFLNYNNNKNKYNNNSFILKYTKGCCYINDIPVEIVVIDSLFKYNKETTLSSKFKEVVISVSDNKIERISYNMS